VRASCCNAFFAGRQYQVFHTESIVEELAAFAGVALMRMNDDRRLFFAAQVELEWM